MAGLEGADSSIIDLGHCVCKYIEYATKGRDFYETHKIYQIGCDSVAGLVNRSVVLYEHGARGEQ